MTDVQITKESSVRSRKSKRTFKFDFSPYLYIGPLVIFLFVFYILPIGISIFLSFTKYNIIQAPVFTGLSNYKKLFSDKTFLTALKNTLVFMGGVVPVQTLCALLMAVWIKAWKKNPLARWVQMLIFVPVISSMILISIVWRILLNGSASPINMLLETFGHRVDWLGNTHIALFTIMFIFVWKNVGYFFVLYLSGLMDIPKVYYDAANVDGASPFQQLIYITIPQLKRTSTLVVFLGALWSFQVFDLIYSLTGGGPGNSTTTLVVYMYNLSFKQFNTGYAMTIANVLFLIAVVLSIVQKSLIQSD